MKRTNGKALSVNNAKRRIGINARRVITLTLSNIALQALGFVYRMMLTDCAGTTALGLQSLVMQIYSIAVSVCISGLNVAVITVAARLNAAGGRGIRTLTRCALLGVLRAVFAFRCSFVYTAQIDRAPPHRRLAKRRVRYRSF